MEYRISINDVQTGPYSSQQLRLMWEHGEVTANAYYYDDLRSEWLPLQGLVEGTRSLFTVEEVFVRLGQNQLKGCLSIYNKEETIHLFVDGGFVVSALGDKQEGEFALSRALHLEDSNYEWLSGAEPLATNLRLNIAEYASNHSIVQEVRIGNTANQMQRTAPLGKVLRDKVELRSGYTLISADAPMLKLRLVKLTNIVGREQLCDVVVDHPKVSRKHCLLEVGEQNVKVKDLDSSNGTFVNGIPIRDGVLNVGDQLRLGRCNLILHKEE